MHGLIGPNGAGKTTVIDLITGLFHPTSGGIHFDGTHLENMGPPQIAALGITRTYQNVRLFSGMTVLEQVMTGCYLLRGVSLWSSFLGLPGARAQWTATRERALHLLGRVGMADERTSSQKPCLTASSGASRSPAPSVGAEASPLDEPTAGMNAQEASAVGRLVHELRAAGLTILMVEHNMGLVTEFCDSCTVINFGRLLAEGDPKACVADPQVQEAYFGRKNDADRLQALR